MRPVPFTAPLTSFATRAGPRDCRAFSAAGLRPPSVCLRLLLLLLILLYRSYFALCPGCSPMLHAAQLQAPSWTSPVEAPILQLSRTLCPGGGQCHEVQTLCFFPRSLPHQLGNAGF